MTNRIIFQETYLVSGVMCFDGCGNIIQNNLQSFIEESIEQKNLPSDAALIIDAEPHSLGIQKLIISIKSADDNVNIKPDLAAKIKDNLGFDVVDESSDASGKQSSWKHWNNILINCLSMGLVIVCAFAFPPSILLTISMAAITFITTAFTAREYLLGFFRNLRAKQFATMTTTVSLGWLLSLGHTIVHAIAMPLLTHFSMVFMSFVMPSILITCINGVDEIKRRIMEKSKKIHLNGLKTVFPQMSEAYNCCQLSEEDMSYIEAYKERESHAFECHISAENKKEKHLLAKGMLIKVNIGECFPVDGILIQGSTIIDTSLVNGESQQNQEPWQEIPAGAINLGQPVIIYALNNSYNSTVNRLLFRSNRAKEHLMTKAKTSGFTYVYLTLIAIGMVGAIIMPFAFGVISVSLIVQNIIGILFSVCPCTIAIAHELPKLLSLHHRNKKDIYLRDEALLNTYADNRHTIVFDKTGTLTTGNSLFESSDIICPALWQRIYLLEKQHGRGHPLANAITRFYEKNNPATPLFNEISEVSFDKNNRGLSATVQGKKLQIGNGDYLLSNGISLPEPDQCKMQQGFSAVYVAEEGVYQGIIYIKHQIRPGVIEALTKLKQAGKKIIMLTGDKHESAIGFNRHLNGIFDENDIHAGQSAQQKEDFLDDYMKKSTSKPQGVWFCGDGLNDAPCCRIVSDNGGVSCAISSNDKTAFFTDMSFNGSIDYLFKHHQLNRYLQQIMMQNKALLLYSSLAFLAFIISFSIVGIAVSPLISVAIMVSTTMAVLFNSYRVQLSVDKAFDASISWPKKIMASNLSIALLFAASFLLMTSVLVATIATGSLALPMIAFSSAIAAFCSVCSLSALGLLSVFGCLATIFLLSSDKNNAVSDTTMHQESFLKPYLPKDNTKNTHSYHSKPLDLFAVKRQITADTQQDNYNQEHINADTQQDNYNQEHINVDW